jgi:hypothetical protein
MAKIMKAAVSLTALWFIAVVHPPRLPDNDFIGCTWKLEDAAERTVGFLALLYIVGAASFVEDILTLIRSQPQLPDRPVQ